MDGRYRRMEDSLKRSAELGRELLERVRCREVGWSCSWEGGPQEAELIEMYHDCLANHRMSQQEVVHTCRFHGRKCIQTGSQRGVAQRTNAPAFTPITTQERPRDIAIEVAPGTYSVSAGLPRAQRQTHVVNICPGQSVDLTFSL
ncbi:A-kinase-interacting protein 1 isoform X2 [Xenopus laevis]|uniref:A-kinase-interacting protein 1 isoform X2 n=1 Tax=Xenopus laevis TaxID=8355 RepID=A0A8J0UZX6_XENLA|nr:A-kinase-interacting protein 1 isoform X2 [Xenopus laevis]